MDRTEPQRLVEIELSAYTEQSLDDAAAAECRERLAAILEKPMPRSGMGRREIAEELCERVLGRYNGNMSWPLQHFEHERAHEAVAQCLERDSGARWIRDACPNWESVLAVGRLATEAMATHVAQHRGAGA